MFSIFSLLLMPTVEAKIGGSTTIGPAAAFIKYRSFLQPGTTLNFRLHFTQGNLQFGPVYKHQIHNGTYYEMQADLQCYNTGNCIQGDTLVMALGGYVSYRIGKPHKFHMVPSVSLLYGSAPLLMNKEYYSAEVLPKWGNVVSSVHESPHPGVDFNFDFRFPIQPNGPGFMIGLNSTYYMGFDLFVGGSMGFYIN